MINKNKILFKKFLTVFTAWFVVVQTMMPTMVLADELPEPSPAPVEVTTQEATTNEEPPATGEVTERSTESPEESSSPQETPSPSPQALMETGDAYATSQTTSLANTTTLDSDIQVTQGDIADPAIGDITPFKTEEATPSATPDPVLATLDEEEHAEVTVDNQVSVTTEAETTANTGGNSQESVGTAEMTTGDAYATAYATSITNTTLIDSSLQIALLSILTEWDGNIVLQPFTSHEISAAIGRLTINNSGEIVTTATADTNTGANVQMTSGDATLTTGSTTTAASANTLANATLIDAILFDFFVQNWTLWTGQVYNFAAPGSRQNPEEVIGRHLLVGASEECNDCSTDIHINNDATVNTSALATATTGNNSQTTEGSSIMTTGNAYASAMAASVTNATLINSTYRLLSLNLLARWTGNLIFAYPDLLVTIEAPSKVKRHENFTYTVHVSNMGYADDSAVTLTSGTYAENIGNLEAFHTESRTYLYENNVSDGSTVTLSAAVGGDTDEESLANNSTSVAVEIIDDEPPPEQITEEDKTSPISHDIPALSLAVSNNIATFIYPGDTSRYEATVTNMGPGTAYDTYFTNVLFDQNGTAVGTIRALVGHLAPNESKTIRFSLATSSTLSPGEYVTLSVVTGRSDDLTPINSNEVSNPVPVQARSLTWDVGSVQAQETEFVSPPQSDGEVLGAATHTCGACQWANTLFIIAATLVALYSYASTIYSSRRLFYMSLSWGLTGYVALLILNPSCANGLLLVSTNWICRYFVPLTVTEALITRTLLALKNPFRVFADQGVR